MLRNGPTESGTQAMKPKTLYLIRGLPGSGKSTLAHTLMGSYRMERCIHLEADMHFVGPDLTYRFNPKELHNAHVWCQRTAAGYMEQGIETVIVSNTFTTAAEMEPYLEAAEKNGYTPFVIHCENKFNGVHDVPPETVARMAARWEPFTPHDRAIE